MKLDQEYFSLIVKMCREWNMIYQQNYTLKMMDIHSSCQRKKFY